MSEDVLQVILFFLPAVAVMITIIREHSRQRANVLASQRQEKIKLEFALDHKGVDEAIDESLAIIDHRLDEITDMIRSGRYDNAHLSSEYARLMRHRFKLLQVPERNPEYTKPKRTLVSDAYALTDDGEFFALDDADTEKPKR